jgi:hypothetical protein
MTKSATREAADKVTFTQAEVTAKDTAARAGRKNLIINGGFDVWQRGTSFTNNNSVLFAADRYATFSNGASTTSQQAFTLGQTDVASNPQYYLRWDVSTYASGDRVYQRIEDVITTSGQSVTLSYWAKAETATTMVPQATQAFGSGGSTAVTTAIDSVALTTSWQKFTRTFTLPSVSGKTIGAGSFLEVGLLRFTTSYTGYVDIANVQLELGSVATDFEHRSYGEILADCQRYFENLMTKEGQSMLISAWAYSVGQVQGVVRFAVDKRATPTMGYEVGIAYQGPNQTARTDVTPLFYIPSIKSVMVYANNGVSVTVGQGTNLVNRDNGTGMIFADAEL